MNSVQLLGRLTKDPDFKATQNSFVANFSLAVNRKFVKEGEERQADFINCVAWGKTAEFCNKYLKKGQQVAISGRIQTRNWDDEQGQKHYATEVIAEEINFADSRKEDNSNNEVTSSTSPETSSYNLEFSDLPF